MKENQMVLIAGPYRSGTGDNLVKIANNVKAMETVAYQVYLMGHTPMLGEWVALPMLREGGSARIGDEIYEKMFHPIAIRLLEHCDVVLRIGGDSTGADEMVSIGKESGKRIIYALEELQSNK